MLAGFHKLKSNTCPDWIFSRDQAISKHEGKLRNKLKCRGEEARIRGMGVGMGRFGNHSLYIYIIKTLK